MTMWYERDENCNNTTITDNSNIITNHRVNNCNFYMLDRIEKSTSEVVMEANELVSSILELIKLLPCVLSNRYCIEKKKLVFFVKSMNKLWTQLYFICSCVFLLIYIVKLLCLFVNNWINIWFFCSLVMLIFSKYFILFLWYRYFFDVVSHTSRECSKNCEFICI